MIYAIKCKKYSTFFIFLHFIGNCNFDPEDDMKKRDGNVAASIEEFGMSWLVETEDKNLCQVYDKEAVPCLPPPPGEDPCLKLMDEKTFGKVHLQFQFRESGAQYLMLNQSGSRCPPVRASE